LELSHVDATHEVFDTLYERILEYFEPPRVCRRP